MSRGVRLDVPDTPHHMTVRGIDKLRIVIDVADLNNFVNRLGIH